MKISTKHLKSAALSLFAGLLLCSCASQRPATVYTAPSVAPTKQKITEAKEHIVKVREFVTQLDKECEKKLPGWQSAYDQLQKENNDAWAAANEAIHRADELQVQNDKLANAASQESAGRAQAVEREKITAFKYHRVKGLLAAAAAAVVLGALLMFGKGLLLLIPPPWNIVAGVGAPALAAVAVFVFL